MYTLADDLEYQQLRHYIPDSFPIGASYLRVVIGFGRLEVS